MYVTKVIKRFKGEPGVTLIELIVIVVIIGVALPSLLSMLGVLSFNQVKNERQVESRGLAGSRIEEILAFKEKNPDWYNTINDFAGEETLEGGFSRTTEVAYIENWGSAELGTYEIRVIVSHPQVANEFSLSVRLTKFTR